MTKPTADSLTKKARSTTAQSTPMQNSLSQFNEVLFQSQLQGGSPLSSTATLIYDTSPDTIFWNRALLSLAYQKHGVIQSLINQPVDDALRKGIEIKTGELDPAQLQELEDAFERDDVLNTVGQATKWTRLFGGGGLVILADEQKQDEPLDIEKINEDTHVELYAADLWELLGLNNEDNIQGMLTNPSPSALEGDFKEASNKADQNECYQFYSQRLHKSRVIKMKGREAPSLFRPRYRGWGMTEVERIIRSINQYLKNQNVMFELLDESKVDVYKIEGFNTAMMSGNAYEKMAMRVQSANQAKNYLSALLMDAKDDWDHKQLNFTGFAEVMQQIRISIAADMKMPLTKLFGVSNAGFSTGEDEIENYNAMLESEIRSKIKWAIVLVLEIYCKKLFGEIPSDLSVDFPALREMSTEEEETVKDRQMNRLLLAYEKGLINTETAQQAINKANLLPVDIEEEGEHFEYQGEQTMKTTTGTVKDK